MKTQDRFYLRRLTRLRSHRIAPGEPDICRWLVIAADGRRIGRVRDLLVDATSLRARYVDVVLDPQLAITAGAPTIALPVECLQVAPVRPYLNLRSVSTDDIVNVPGFGTAPISTAEDSLLRQFFRCDDRDSRSEDFWRLRRRERAALPYVLAQTA